MKRHSIYFIGLICLCILTWEYISDAITFSKSIKGFFYLFTSLCFVSNIFSQGKYYAKELAIMVILLMLSLYTALVTNFIVIFLDYLAIISSKNISTDKIVKVIFYFNLSFLIGHFLLTELGIFIPTSAYYTSVGLFRYTFCLRHPNYLAAVIFWTFASYIYFCKKSVLYQEAINILVMFFTYRLTYSRTTLILFMLLGFMLLLLNIKNQIKVINILKYSLLIVIILSLIISYRYFYFNDSMKELINILNNILSNRLLLNNIGLHSHSLTLFGQSINYLAYISYQNITLHTLVIDSFYVTCLIHIGIVHLFILFYAFIKYTKRMYNYKSWMLLFILLVAAISERYIIYISLAFPLFFFKNVLFINDTKEAK